MEFKGTKGKWHHHKDETCIVDDKGFGITEVDYPFRIDIDWGEKGAKHWNEKGFHIEISEQEASANALLISKAPELLEMLSDVFENVQLPSGKYLRIQQLIKEATEID